MPNKYVLWVRHCEGCHNKARAVNVVRKMLTPIFMYNIRRKTIYYVWRKIQE